MIVGLVNTARKCALLLLGVSLFPTHQASADEVSERAMNHSAWLFARGRMQLLNSMMSSPSDGPAFSVTAGSGAKPLRFDQCLRADLKESWFVDACTELIHAEIFQAWQKNKKIQTQLLEKANIFFAILKSSRQSLAWSTWLRMASVKVLAGDTASAKEYLRRARDSLAPVQSPPPWVAARLDVFERGLEALDEGSKQAEKRQESVIQTSEFDDSTTFLAGRVESLIRAQDSLSREAESSRSTQEKMDTLVRSKWIVAMDRAEIEALKDQALNLRVDPDFIRRVDALLTNNQVVNEDWTFISTVVPGVTNGALRLAKQEQILLPFEIWLSGRRGYSALPMIDEDNTVHKLHMILNECIQTHSGALDKIASMLSAEGDLAYVNVLSERLKGMTSSTGVVLNRSEVSEKYERINQVRTALTDSELRLRRLNARIAALQLLNENSQNNLSLEKIVSDEMTSLRAARRDIMINFFSSTTNLMPYTLAQAELLKMRLNQMRRTVVDMRALLSSSRGRRDEATQADLFMNDTIRLLEGMENKLSSHLQGKHALAKITSRHLESITSGTAEVEEGLQDFLTSVARQLRPQFIKVLQALDGDLLRRERALALQQQIAQDELRNDLTRQRMSLEKRKGRVNDLHRMRGENLEWRTGR